MRSGYASIASDTFDAQGFQSIHHDARDTGDTRSKPLVSGCGGVVSGENLLFPDEGLKKMPQCLWLLPVFLRAILLSHEK